MQPVFVPAPWPHHSLGRGNLHPDRRLTWGETKESAVAEIEAIVKDVLFLPDPFVTLLQIRPKNVQKNKLLRCCLNIGKRFAVQEGWSATPFGQQFSKNNCIFSMIEL
jgi:hypothetical protein